MRLVNPSCSLFAGKTQGFVWAEKWHNKATVYMHSFL